jgi:DNA end-binding protein Ku
MPRAIWSGAISFGLVNIPIKLFSAVQSKTVHFNQIDKQTGSRVRYKKVAEADGREVESDDIVKGYEMSPGSYVTVEPDELDALDPKAVRTVEIEEFVDLDEIDPIFFSSAYQVAPSAGAAKPYRLLVEAMAEANKVAIAKFVMRSKEYLAAVRAVDGKLLLSTMVYADEVVDRDLPEYEQLDEVEVTDKEMASARQLIEALAADFEPAKYQDTYREKVLDLIEQKAAGEQIVVTAEEAEPQKVIDLMAALEESVAAARSARKRHPTSRKKAGAQSKRTRKSA